MTNELEEDRLRKKAQELYPGLSLRLRGSLVEAFYNSKVVGGSTSLIGAIQDAVDHPERADPSWGYP